MADRKEISGGFLKLKTAQKKAYDNIHRSLTQILFDLQQQQNNSPTEASKLQFEANIKERTAQINENLKNYHAQISKYTKVLEKIPTESPLDLNSPQLDPRVDPYLLFAIQHLIRQAKRSTVEALISSGHYSLNESERAHLYSISPVLEALHSDGNLEIVEDWIFAHSLQIQQMEDRKLTTDHLTFHVCVLRYLTYLSAGSMDQYLSAISLSQSLFPYFLTTFPGEYDSRISELMGCLLIALPGQGPFQTLPWLHLYPHLSIQTATENLSSILIETSAQLHGLPQKDHLESLVRIGRVLQNIFDQHIGQLTAPTIRKALNLKAFNNSQLNDQKSPLTWQDLQDLPLEFPEDDSLIFHTVFTCPVSREVATPENPPVLLSCGHAILKSSMKQLPKKASGRFKCPTCYGDARMDDIIELQM